MSRANLEIFTCTKGMDITDILPEDMERNTALYLWALIQQEADTKARANRKQWRVMQGGKPPEKPVAAITEGTGQMSWGF